MTSEVDITNRALSSIGTRSQVVSLTENSNEAKSARLLIEPLRNELLRLAPWNFCRNYINATLICAAPGTPENPSGSPTQWAKGIPAPPWIYEYAYPSDCARLIYIIPQFSSGFVSTIPLTPVTAGTPNYWIGPPVKWQIALDQIDQTTGKPSNTGIDTKVVLTNQQNAIFVYNKEITDPNIMDEQFIQAWVAALAGRLVFALIGDKGLANIKIQEANAFITAARSTDGNEGLTVNDVTPDWIRTRGIAWPIDSSFSPWVNFDWGGMLPLY